MNEINDLTKNYKQYEVVKFYSTIKKVIKKYQIEAKINFFSEAIPEFYENKITNFEYKNNEFNIRLAIDSLFGAKGVLPNYIQDEVLNGVFNDNHALMDFLNIFNQKIIELKLKLEQQKWIFRENTCEDNLLNLPYFINCLFFNVDINKSVKYAFAIRQGGIRNIKLLNNIISDSFSYKIKIKPRLIKYELLARHDLSKLSTKSSNNQLGKGIFLGKSCVVNNNELIVYITPRDKQEFELLKDNNIITDEIRFLIGSIIRTHTKIHIYLSVKREYLRRPKISTNSKLGFRLGQIDYFSSNQSDDNFVNIILN